MTSRPAHNPRNWTYNDYLRLDDDTRYEIIEGALEVVPAPTLEHQGIVGELYTAFRSYVFEHACGKVYVSPVDIVLSDRNIVQPDVVFVAAARAEILHPRAIMGAPDLAVEIISPSSTSRDRVVKRKLYERFGVKEYWLVDPASRSIEVCALEAQGYRLVAHATVSGTVSSLILPGFLIDITQVFS